MNHKTKPSLLFKRAIILINTLWLPALVYYFLEHVGCSRSFGIPLTFSKFIDPLISLVFETALLSWVWGLIFATFSGESSVGNYNHFKLVLKTGWWIAATYLLTPFITHFLLFILTGHETITLPLIKAFLGIFLMYWSARQILQIKYQHITGKIKAPHFSWELLICSSVLFFIWTSLTVISSRTTTFPLLKTLLDLLTIQTSFLTFAIFSRSLIDNYPAISNNFQSAKTLILINPPAGSIRSEAFSTITMHGYPPFFAVLRALTPADYRILEYNRTIWREHFFRDNALVAISCFTTNCAAAYQLSREFKMRGAKVVLGGPHVSFFPKEALEFCDSVVIGQAEGVWPEILIDYEKGCLKQIYQGQCSGEDSDLVYQSILKSPVNIIRSCLQISPGCKFNCYFCAATAVSGPRKKKRPVADIIALLRKARSPLRPLVFLDNNIYEDPAYAKELFRAMIPLKQPWAASTSIDIAQDAETLQLLKQSKCVQLLIGYEIDSGSSLQERKGKFALAQDYLPLTQKLQQAGIAIQAQFIFGFPDDSWASLARLWRFCLKLSPNFTIVSFMTPLPGANYFEDAFRRRQVINLNWRCYDLFRQVTETNRLKCSWILQNCYSLIAFFIFLTTSSMGRLGVLIFIIGECIYYSVIK